MSIPTTLIVLTFSIFLTIYIIKLWFCGWLVLPLHQNKNKKLKNNLMRIYRDLEDDVKRRISQSLTGRPLSDQHKANISKSMTEYWKTIPNKPKEDNV